MSGGPVAVACQLNAHDLGKHSVATLSRYAGIKVINLGKDVSVESGVERA